MKTSPLDEVTRSQKAIEGHDRAVEAAQARIRELETQHAEARSAAATAWQHAGSGIADGGAVEALTMTAMTRDGEVRALQNAVETLRQRLATATTDRHALVFTHMVNKSKIMCDDADAMLEEWYAELQRFLTISQKASRFMRELETLTDEGTPHRNHCQSLGFPVDEDAWTPSVPMPYGFVYDTFERQASAHWLPEYRAYVADKTPEGRFTKAKARVSELLSKVGLRD